MCGAQARSCDVDVVAALTSRGVFSVTWNLSCRCGERSGVGRFGEAVRG